MIVSKWPIFSHYCRAITKIWYWLSACKSDYQSESDIATHGIACQGWIFLTWQVSWLYLVIYHSLLQKGMATGISEVIGNEAIVKGKLLLLLL